LAERVLVERQEHVGDKGVAGDVARSQGQVVRVPGGRARPDRTLVGHVRVAFGPRVQDLCEDGETLGGRVCRELLVGCQLHKCVRCSAAI
jgi:hypothetical protein